ncbi:hypothetical protein Nepgr_022212 [Nepenthes gracilis]|uniref:Uncharacterized protein n=1 Tax=Nepenthes gracilis TaxID=150966 RepID=A0AAD3XY62_NEPGR|nr:hypothetical protein Nepgr_022212 [Nepenthes gracilis]
MENRLPVRVDAGMLLHDSGGAQTATKRTALKMCERLMSTKAHGQPGHAADGTRKTEKLSFTSNHEFEIGISPVL